MNHSKAIKLIRASKGLSQRDLARMLKVDPSLVSKVETERTPSEEFIDKFCNTLGIPVDLFQLLSTENEENFGKYRTEYLAESLLKLLTGNGK